MVAQSSQALPSKSHRDHPTVSWASESAKALFHETKLLLAPMKFPRPGLRWVRPEGHVFGGSKTGRFGEAATTLGHNIFYWLSRDGGVWKCVRWLHFPNKVTSASRLTMFNVPTIQQLPCHLVRCKAKSIESINHRDGRRLIVCFHQRLSKLKITYPLPLRFPFRKVGHGFVLRRLSNRKSILDVHPDHFGGLSGVGNEETDQFGVPSVASQVDPLILIPTLKPLGDSSHICMKIYCLKPSNRFLCWISCMTHQLLVRHLIDVYHMALNLLVIIGIEEETPQYILLFSNDVDIWDSSPVEATHQPILSKRPHQEFRFQLPCIDPAIQQDPSNLAIHQFVEGWNNRLCIQWMQHTSP